MTKTTSAQLKAKQEQQEEEDKKYGH